MLIRILTSLVNISKHTKCVSLNNQKCMAQPTFLNLLPNNAIKDYATIHLQLI